MKQSHPLWASAALSALLLLSGCSQFNVIEDYDSKANFQNLSSYQWLPATLTDNKKITTTRADHPLTASRVQSAIESTLQTKGFTRTQRQPGSYVSFYIDSKRYMTPDPNTVQFGFGTHNRFGTGFMFETAPSYIETRRADLVIQFFNPQGKVIWQSKAQINLNMDATPQAKMANIQEMVSQMLKNFPP